MAYQKNDNLPKDVSSFISHELRNPLSSMQGALGLIDAGHFGELSHEGKALLDAAMRNAERLTRLARFIENQPYTMQSLLSAQDMGYLQIENEFASVFDLKDFQLLYQPIVSTEAQRVMGFEALARWNHPTKGWVSPCIFIPLAEKTGLIHSLGLSLLRKACLDLKIWQTHFPATIPLVMSFNLSIVQLNDTHLPKKIQSILEEVDLESDSLKLETTESVFIKNSAAIHDVLQQLQTLGIQLYLDDFGVGYSSLSRLNDLPLDALKIDRSFVYTKNWTLSEAVVGLAAKLALDVIAEGVETIEDLEILKAMGCQKMQGNLFSKPISAKVASNLLYQQSLNQNAYPTLRRRTSGSDVSGDA